jgi:hypothetical protein
MSIKFVHADNGAHMRMRPIHSAAVAFVAALAVTGRPSPAEAFLPLPIPIPMLQQSQPPVESRSSGRSPIDNNLRKRSDRGKYESAQPVKPSTGTRAKRDEESSSASSGKSGKSQAKSEATSQATRTRSVRQDPPASKSSGRASATVHRESPAGGRSTPPATQTAQPNETSANSGSQAPSPARAGSTLGDTYDEALGEVFKARIDDLLK